MRINELFESREADLYHGTNLETVSMILQSNIIKARSLIKRGVIPHLVKGQQRTVSFSRDPAMSTNFARSKAQHQQDVSGIPVLLVIDQNRLYRAVGKRLQPYNDLDLHKGHTERSTTGSESEEVVFGDITNANFFIKKIIIHMPNHADSNMLNDLAKTDIINDPRVVVVDFIDKTLTGRQFMDIIQNQSNNVNTTPK